jgi:hypothetical protein
MYDEIDKVKSRLRQYPQLDPLHLDLSPERKADGVHDALAQTVGAGTNSEQGKQYKYCYEHDSAPLPQKLHRTILKVRRHRVSSKK